jgi:TPP-dependent indolepyruvate ferredoxin oxidoreductase alpha subunit
MDAMDIINRALAMPKTHVVVTRYECGKERRFESRNIASAENWATGERRKIGRDLIDRETGATVRVVSVEIEAL